MSAIKYRYDSCRSAEAVSVSILLPSLVPLGSDGGDVVAEDEGVSDVDELIGSLSAGVFNVFSVGGVSSSAA